MLLALILGLDGGALDEALKAVFRISLEAGARGELLSLSDRTGAADLVTRRSKMKKTLGGQAKRMPTKRGVVGRNS